MFLVTNSNHKKIGVVRFDREASTSTISINLNPLFRGQGYGKKSLKECLDIYFQNFDVNEIIAKIDPGNLVSKKLFQGMGFKDTGKKDQNQQIITKLKRSERNKSTKCSRKGPDLCFRFQHPV